MTHDLIKVSDLAVAEKGLLNASVTLSGRIGRGPATVVGFLSDDLVYLGVLLKMSDGQELIVRNYRQKMGVSIRLQSVEQREAPKRGTSKRLKRSGPTTDDVLSHAGGPVTVGRNGSLHWSPWVFAKRLFPGITTGQRVHCFALRIRRPDLIEFS